MFKLCVSDVLSIGINGDADNQMCFCGLRFMTAASQLISHDKHWTQDSRRNQLVLSPSIFSWVVLALKKAVMDAFGQKMALFYMK